MIFIVFTVGLLFAGYFYYKDSEKQFKTDIEDQLTAISELKVNEIVHWRNERIGDGSFFNNNDVFSALVKRYLTDINDLDAKIRIQTWLKKSFSNYKYTDVQLIDTNCLPVMSFPDRLYNGKVFISKNSMGSLLADKVILQDFYYNSSEKKIFIKVLSPVFDETNKSKLLGIVVLKISPEEYLFPLMNSWPIPNKTAETLILRRDSNQVVFLNELKFQKNTALKLSFPLSKTEIPAVKAALGQEGIVEGLDYRGVEVIASLKAIKGSPWFMVARMDKSEIYAPLHEKKLLLIFLIFIIFIAGLAGIGMAGRHRRIKYYKDRLEAEEKLRKTEENLSITLNSIGDGVISTDENGLVVHMNPIAENLCGCTLAVSYGKPLNEVFRIINAQTRKSVINPVSIVLEKGIVVGLANHTVLISKDGNEYQIADTASPIRNKEGNIIGVVLVFSDVTDEYRNIEALRKSEERFRIAFDNMLEGCQIIGFDWTYLYINNSANIQNNRPNEELLGNRYMDMWPGIEELEIFRKIKRCMDERIPIYFENEFVFPDGQMAWFDLSIQPVPEGVLIQSFDITQRKTADEKMQKISRHYQSLIEKAPDGIVLLNAEGNFKFISPSARKIFGFNLEDLITKNPAEFTHPDDLPNVLSNLMMLFQDPDYVPTLQYRFSDVDGKWKWVETTFSNLLNDPSVESIVLNFRDITDRKHAEQKLIESERTFHEMFYRSPVTIIITTPFEGKFIDVNDTFLRDMEFTRDEVIGRTTVELGIFDNPEDRKNVLLKLEEKGSVFAQECRFRSKYGKIMYGLVSIVFIQLNGETCQLSTVIDITDRKQAEDKLLISETR